MHLIEDENGDWFELTDEQWGFQQKLWAEAADRIILRDITKSAYVFNGVNKKNDWSEYDERCLCCLRDE